MVIHIASTIKGEMDKAICGEKIILKWTYLDLDHWYNNQDTYKITCKKCLEKIQKRIDREDE